MKLLCKIAVALVAVGVGSAVCAQELTGTLKKIKDTGAITIGYRESSIPFSYLDDKQQPIGYAMDLCMKVVDAVKTELKMSNLKVNLQPVTSSNRIPLLQNGTIDMECGSTTNSVDRQKQVAFGPTYFVINVTAAVKKSSGIKSLADLNGKTISTTAGTTSVPLLRQYDKTKNAEIKSIDAKDHAESFLLVDTGRASAWMEDDILVAGFRANAKIPGDFKLLEAAYPSDPYALMFRRDDPQFKVLVDETLTGLMRSGEFVKLYTKWFENPIPPKGINIQLPMSDKLKELVKEPNDKANS